MSVADRIADLVRAWGLSDLQRRDLEALAEQAASATRDPLLTPTLPAEPRVDLERPYEPERTDELVVLGAGPAPGRYEDLGELGTGATSEVRRVRDRELNRTMAMKILREGLASRPRIQERFIVEAQATAQLQHAGIPPVHELASLGDGRLYFTMREVRGRTLSSVFESDMPMRRKVDLLLKAAEAVGFAHSRGVVHRDLKPENIMVGAHGEVLVVDWGLAKVLGRMEPMADIDPIETDRTASGTTTRHGIVAGTPTYMAPEQARGEVGRIDARSDVYALGAILYELLAHGPPYQGDSGLIVLSQVLSGPPPALPSGVPPELAEVCARAMARERDERHPDSAAFATDLRDWLDGARQRERALRIVARAQAALPEAEIMRMRAGVLHARARQLLAGVPPHAPEADKAEAWALEDEANQLERDADLKGIERHQLLQGALTLAADLPEAHVALGEEHLAAHRASEAARDADGARRAEISIRAHASALPADHPFAIRCATYLRGEGTVSLVTEPAGAEVTAEVYALHHRRLLPAERRVLGATPLHEVALPRGSYLLTLRAPGRAPARYPVFLERETAWTGVPPTGSEPAAVPLLEPRASEPDATYVPPGWFWSGGGETPRQRLWCDGFEIGRFPVTNRQYIAFLDDLVAQGREHEALALAPRSDGGSVGGDGQVLYGRDADGRFVLRPDPEGDVWNAEWPVFMVHWGCAVAYCRWLTERTGASWRLPSEHEWEKAARGVDGRRHPWGDAHDPSWRCMRQSHDGRPLPQVVDSFEVDTSPYGVRGMGGNVQDWCADPFADAGPVALHGRAVRPPDAHDLDVHSSARRPVRGGSYFTYAEKFTAESRNGVAPLLRHALVGFRVARST